MVPHAGHWAIISLLKCPQRCMFKRWRSLLIAPSTIRILVLFELLFLIKRPKASGLAHNASWEGGTTYTSTSSITSHSVMTSTNFLRSQSHLILMTVLQRRRYGNVDMLVVLMYQVVVVVVFKFYKATVSNKDYWVARYAVQGAPPSPME